MGHPVDVYTPERLEEIRLAAIEYTEKTAIPILAEFAYGIGVLRQELYKHPELSDAIKQLITKKEFQLEKMAMVNKVNTTFAIFSLKQIGWTDKLETSNKTTIEDNRDLSKLSDKELDQLEKLTDKIGD